jgi:FMNH2-dependent dimethyl sulfone monooxygenase
MKERRARLAPDAPPMTFGVAGYVICRPTMEEAVKERARITDVKASKRGYDNYNQWLSGTKLEQRVSLEEYSVSNRGLRTGLVGTPELIAERLDGLARAGIDLTLLQFSPQLEEMERFGSEVIPLTGANPHLPPSHAIHEQRIR